MHEIDKLKKDFADMTEAIQAGGGWVIGPLSNVVRFSPWLRMASRRTQLPK
jgi:hypothetical protein